MEWKCIELHTHTFHSDGDFSLQELCSIAKKFLYDAIALTDHNTMSGMDFSSGEERLALPVIPGIEWTTYYGHMLVIGDDCMGDWRFVRPDTIDEYINGIKESGGVVGIAHPFALGGPICSGCRWDFNVRNWNNIDYIEVFNRPFPHKDYMNDAAFKWWTELLNQGHHIAASAGWDLHRLKPEKQLLIAATWLGLPDGTISTQTVKEALASGRTIVSCGPFPDISLYRGDKTYFPGDTLEKGRLSFSISVNEKRRKEVWHSFGIRTKTLHFTHNGNSIKTFSYRSGDSYEGSIDLSPGWFRLEGYGDLDGEKNKLLFFTSPWYIC